MPFGIDVGLSPGDFVLDGDPVPSAKRGRSPLPNFIVERISLLRQDAET